MCNRFKFALITAILLNTLMILSGQSDKGNLIEQKLSWAPVTGAWGYEVLIREGAEEITRERINQSEYTFSLPPGEYEFAIVVLNKFKKTVSMTDWKPLIIKEAYQPVVRRFSPEQVYQNRGETLTIKAEVYQVRENTQFFLTDSSGKETPGILKELNNESVVLEFPLNELAPDSYTLKALDSSGLSDTSEINTLTVIAVSEPQIRSVSEKRLIQQQVYPDIIVRGKAFREGISARIFMEDQQIIPYEIQWISEEEVRIALITGDIPPGRYNLEMTDPSGNSVIENRAFIIDEAPLTQIIREVPREDSFSILGGYDFTMNIRSDIGEYDVTPLGLGVKVRQDLANRIFWRIPGLRPLGLELDMDWTSMHYRNADYNYNQTYIGLHFTYTIPLLKDWFILPAAGFGMTSLHVRNEGESLQGELSSALTLSMGALKEYKNGVLLEFGLDYRENYYTGGTLGNLYPWVMGGYRF